MLAWLGRAVSKWGTGEVHAARSGQRHLPDFRRVWPPVCKPKLTPATPPWSPGHSRLSHALADRRPQFCGLYAAMARNWCWTPTDTSCR